MNDKLWDEIECTIEKFAPEACAISDWMAHHPELGGEEFQACKKHTHFLSHAGFEVTFPYCDLSTSYNATLRGAGEGARIALLAEYDALPEFGHACGHNVHGAMSLLAGAGLTSLLQKVPGSLRVVGTPAEESWGGKIVLSERGAFNDLDLAMMIHASAGESYVDYRALAMCAYEFTFQGKSAHAAGTPWEGANALNGVRALFDSLDMLRQHLRPEVRIHGIISNGGEYPNIVPEKAVAKFYFRAPTKNMLEAVKEKAFHCADAAALATETTVSWKLFENPASDIKPNKAADSLFEKVYEEMGIERTPSRPATDSTDVGDVSYCCPAVQPVLNVAGGRHFPLHTRDFATVCASPEVHAPLILGAKILAKAALYAFIEPSLIQKIKEDFAKRRSGDQG